MHQLNAAGSPQAGLQQHACTPKRTWAAAGGHRSGRHSGPAPDSCCLGQSGRHCSMQKGLHEWDEACRELLLLPLLCGSMHSAAALPAATVAALGSDGCRWLQYYCSSLRLHWLLSKQQSGRAAQRHVPHVGQCNSTRARSAHGRS